MRGLLMLPGLVELSPRLRFLFRGPSNATIVLPGWAAYCILRDVEGEGVLDQLPVMYADGTGPHLYWGVGEVLPIRSGCGLGDVLVLGGSGQETVEIWAAPPKGRSEAWEDAPRVR